MRQSPRCCMWTMLRYFGRMHVLINIIIIITTLAIMTTPIAAQQDTDGPILTDKWLVTSKKNSSSSSIRIGRQPPSQQPPQQQPLALSSSSLSWSSRRPLQQQQYQQYPHHHRRLLFSELLNFIFGLFGFGNFTTCRAVGDGRYETREGLDIFSYFFAVTLQGETAGVCSCTVDCDNDEEEPDETFPVGNGAVGQVCNTDDDCTDPFVCNTAHHVCLASPDCNILKHKVGDPFTNDRITLVFVGSSFPDHAVFTDAVTKNYEAINTFEFFAEDIALLNVMYVLPSEGQKTGYCFQPCGNIDRLLCCNTNDARALSSRCFTSPTNVQTLVLHNNVTYGGAGYPSANVATASLSPLGPKILVHELGHSLFEFGDEYQDGTATSFYANCDNVGCPKWSDLVGRNLAGYNPVACVSNVCSGGQYYAGERSYMDRLELPIGAVNARFACCAYLSLTKSTPSYCSKFDFSTNALLAYCRDNDYQHFGKETYTRIEGRSSTESTVFFITIEENNNTSNRNIFNNNALISITREAVARRPIANQGVVFFPSLAEASSLLPGFRRVIVLEYKLASAASATRLFVSATAEVHIPLLSSSSSSSDSSDSVRLDTNFIQVVVDANVDDVEYVTAELVVID